MRQRGSILKPGGARKTWSVQYRTPAGKRIFKGGFGTKTAAQQYLNEVLGQIDTGVYVQRKPVQFAVFAEQWLTARKRIRGSTESSYASIVNAQLIPRIGPIKLCDLQLADIEKLVEGLMEDNSTKSIHNIVSLLRTMLSGKKGAGVSAMRRGYLAADPTVGLELPALEGVEISPPAAQQVWTLIEAAKEIGGVGYPIAFLAAYTGLRRGEILALRYDDVDWMNSEIRIRNAISRERSRDGAHKWAWAVGETKSKKGRRRISIPQTVLKTLSERRALVGGEFIFPAASGSFIDPDVFGSEIWAPIAKHANMPDTRFHDLRHFFASQLIANGENPKYVQDQLGHSSIQVTFDTYGHLFPLKGAESARRYEKAMAEARGTNAARLSARDEDSRMAN